MALLARLEKDRNSNNRRPPAALLTDGFSQSLSRSRAKQSFDSSALILRASLKQLQCSRDAAVWRRV